MSAYSSLYVGMSGMRSNERALEIIGNNLANMNTIGFKSSRAIFSEAMNQTILGSAGTSQIGPGSTLAGVQRLMTQGSLLGTNVTTDLALSGDGFFQVKDAEGKSFYTRDGQFSVDQQGFMQSIDGMRLQGYPADASGDLSVQIQDLRVGQLTSAPNSTDKIEMDLNLDAGATDMVFDPANPATTSSFSSTVTVYDSLGGSHSVDVYFSKSADGEWAWNAMAPSTEVDQGGAVGGEFTVVASGTMSFDDQGQLTAEAQDSGTVTWVGGSAEQTLNFSFADENGDGTTSFRQASALNYLQQDGFGAGSLEFVTIDSDGIISGSFSNASQRVLGRIAVARFSAADQLAAVGQNKYEQTQLSGDPAIGYANEGGRGEIFSGALEQSNVDLTNEFTQMIVVNRGYQASSRTVSTADDLLAEAVNLKR